MRAIVQDRYGPPSVLRLDDVEDPLPGPGEVLVRVRAAGVNALDWRLVRGDPFLLRLAYGLTKPKLRIPGADVAGVIAAVGDGVARLRPGDEVFADLSNAKLGAFAELVAAPEDLFAAKPRALSFEEAAAVPVAGSTALQALRDVANVRAGEKVLVNGAAGGVGTFAVQLARAMGAEVAAVARAAAHPALAKLGAARSFDYTQEDPTKLDERFDVVLDCAAHRAPGDWRRVLRDGGRYVLVGGDLGPMLRVLAFGGFLSRGGRRFLVVSAKASRADLEDLARRADAREMRPLLDRAFPLAEAAEAVRHLDEGHPVGKTVLRVDA